MEKEQNAQIVEQFERLRTILDSAELDVMRNARGNSSAGNRARKALRLLKKESGQLVKLTIEVEKERKAAKE